MTTGASFGAYHAMSHSDSSIPVSLTGSSGLSGMYDIRSMTGGYSDEYVYLYNPPEFIPNEHDPGRIHELQKLDIIMTAGKHDSLLGESQHMSGILWGKGIGNALREWDGWSHDWPYWKRQITMYINGSD